MGISDDPQFWIWLLSPIWLALIAKFFLMDAPKGIQIAAMVLVNIAPHIYLMGTFGTFDGDRNVFMGLFAYLAIMYLNIFTIWITLPVTAVLIGISSLIIWHQSDFSH